MSLGKSATPLGKVKGLGASGEGGHHWLEERFTSIALILLSMWFIFSLALLPNLGRETLVEWLVSPWAAIPMALLVITAFRHGIDGLKVVVDDYVHNEGNRIALHYCLSMVGTVGAAVSLFALAKIAFGAA